MNWLVRVWRALRGDWRRKNPPQEWAGCTLMRVYHNGQKVVAEFYDWKLRGLMAFTEDNLMLRIKNGERYGLNVSEEYKALAMIEEHKAGLRPAHLEVKR